MAEKKEAEEINNLGPEDKLVGAYAKLAGDFFQEEWDENEYTKEYK
jgi:hypothetical protein